MRLVKKKFQENVSYRIDRRKEKKLKPTNKIADEEEGVTVGINSGGVVRQK